MLNSFFFFPNWYWGPYQTLLPGALYCLSLLSSPSVSFKSPALSMQTGYPRILFAFSSSQSSSLGWGSSFLPAPWFPHPWNKLSHQGWDQSVAISSSDGLLLAIVTFTPACHGQWLWQLIGINEKYLTQNEALFTPPSSSLAQNWHLRLPDHRIVFTLQMSLLWFSWLADHDKH